MRKVAAIIPARMRSTRYPGKPLLDFEGLPMVEHVRRRALLSGAFSEVVVATCDQEIKVAIENFGGQVLMTSPDHLGATDRVAEAASRIDCTHVVNVQGDEILIIPKDLKNLVQMIDQDKKSVAWNAIGLINHKEELNDSSIVKCMVSVSNRIMYCSRNFSTFPFKDKFDPIRIILGILAYEKEYLIRYNKLKCTPAEQLERIDQNRIIENDEFLQGVLFSKGYPGINEPKEVPLVQKYLSEDKIQKNILEAIKKEF